ncbi:integrase core domain-containing protein [Methylobacterium sp. P31]
MGAKNAHRSPGSPWESGYNQSFDARLRDDLLNGETVYSPGEAQILIENWRRNENGILPRASWATARRSRRCSCRR